MRPSITKGMILAAGLGTRLLPITEKLPKPLVPVLNVPNILHSLFLLKRAGIRDVIINVHHLPDVMENFLGDGQRWGFKISYSREPLLLGTGGGLKKAESFFAGQPLVLVNCDFISDVDLVPMIARHFDRGALATMVLHQDEVLQPFYSKVGTDPEGRLCSFPRFEIVPPARTGIFTGIHILSNEVFSYLQEVPSGINEILYPALMKETPRRAFGEYQTGAYWYDTGERSTLWMASMRLLQKLMGGHPILRDFMSTFGGYEQDTPGIWLAQGVRPPATVTLMPPVVIGKDCTFGKGVTVGPNTLIGDACQIGEGAQVANFVALGAAQIPGNRVSEDALQFQGLTLPAKKLP